MVEYDNNDSCWLAMDIACARWGDPFDGNVSPPLSKNNEGALREIVDASIKGMLGTWRKSDTGAVTNEKHTVARGDKIAVHSAEVLGAILLMCGLGGLDVMTQRHLNGDGLSIVMAATTDGTMAGSGSVKLTPLPQHSSEMAQEDPNCGGHGWQAHGRQMVSSVPIQAMRALVANLEDWIGNPDSSDARVMVLCAASSILILWNEMEIFGRQEMVFRLNKLAWNGRAAPENRSVWLHAERWLADDEAKAVAKVLH